MHCSYNQQINSTMSEIMKNECDDLHFTVVYTYKLNVKLNVIKNATVMGGMFCTD